jgi:hypothetical protein
MEQHKSGWIFSCSLAALVLCGSFSAQAADACFASSRIYQIHPVRGGGESRDGWKVKGDTFPQCVHRAEAADKSLHAHYPDSVYALSPTSTIGCHQPC